MPSLDKLYGDLKGRGLEVVLVAFREPADRVRQTVRERRYTPPVLLDEKGDVTGMRYGVFGPPTVYVIDRDGRMLARAAGPVDWSRPAARKALEDLLGGPPR